MRIASSSLRSIAGAIAVLLLSGMLSYGGARYIRGLVVKRGSNTGVRTRPPGPPSGHHLIAFVLLSSECGFCAEKHTKIAVSQLRDSLLRSQSAAFQRISVVGVAVDRNIDNGLKYLRGLSRSGIAFDEISVGGMWLNETITALVWREAVGTPSVPQVLVIEREVDASAFPGHIEIRSDSLLLRVSGRDSLIDWVAHGTPLVLQPSAARQQQSPSDPKRLGSPQ